MFLFKAMKIMHNRHIEIQLAERDIASTLPFPQPIVQKNISSFGRNQISKLLKTLPPCFLSPKKDIQDISAGLMLDDPVLFLLQGAFI